VTGYTSTALRLKLPVGDFNHVQCRVPIKSQETRYGRQVLENSLADLPQKTPGSQTLWGAEAEDFTLLFHEFFGFRENPFSNTPDPGFFYMSRNHKEALLSMLFGVKQRRGFIVVTGEIGAGKTTLVRHFLQQLPQDLKTAVILNPKISTTHLLSSVARDFGIPNPGKTRRSIYEGLSKFLLQGMQHDQNACLIIDESQCLNVKVLEEIRLLSNLETAKQKLIQIVLVGQPEMREVLMQPSLTQLRQRIGVYVHLNGLSRDDTSAYIEHRLQQVGDGTVKILFESSVIRKIHEISRGIPRLINALCDRILMSAFAQQTYAIHDSVAATAFEELAFICAEAAKN